MRNKGKYVKTETTQSRLPFVTAASLLVEGPSKRAVRRRERF